MRRFPAQGRNENRTEQFFVTGLPQSDGTWNPEGAMSGRGAPGRGENRENRFRENVMSWIEQQATEAWAPAEAGTRALAAFDFLTVCVKPVPAPAPPNLETEEVGPRAQWIQTDQPSSSTDPGQSSGPGRGYEQHGGGSSSTFSDEKPSRKRQRTEREVKN